MFNIEYFCFIVYLKKDLFKNILFFKTYKVFSKDKDFKNPEIK